MKGSSLARGSTEKEEETPRIAATSPPGVRVSRRRPVKDGQGLRPTVAPPVGGRRTPRSAPPTGQDRKQSGPRRLRQIRETRRGGVALRMQSETPTGRDRKQSGLRRPGLLGDRCGAASSPSRGDRDRKQSGPRRRRRTGVTLRGQLSSASRATTSGRDRKQSGLRCLGLRWRPVKDRTQSVTWGRDRKQSGPRRHSV